MKIAIYILGFLFNISFLLGTVQLPLAGASAIFWVVLIAFCLIGRASRIRIPADFAMWVAAFLIYYTISFVTGPKSEYSVYKFSMVMVKFPAMFLIPFLISNHYKSFFRGYLTASVLGILILLAQSRSMLAGAGPDVNTRLEVGALNPIWISRQILEALLLLILIFKPKRRWIYLVALISLPVLFTSGSKGPIVGFLIAMLFYAMQGFRFTVKNFSYILLGVAVLAVIGVGISRLDENSYFVQRFLRAVPDASSEEIKEMSRVFVWPNTIEKLGEAPVSKFLFGYGAGNFSLFYWNQISSERFYPHNLFLELFVEQGFVFFLFSVIGFIVFYRRGKNNFRFLFLFCFTCAMFSGDLILNESMFLYLSFAVMSKLNLHESTLPHTRKLSEPTDHPLAGIESV